jgi:DNA-binding response OmpR family regulator
MRLLLVEDDAELNQSLQQQLTKEGFAIDVADNGVEIIRTPIVIHQLCVINLLPDNDNLPM